MPESSSIACDQAVFVYQASDASLFAAASTDPAFSNRAHARRRDVAQHGPDPAIGQDRVEPGSEVRAAVADHELDPVRFLAEVHDQVAGLLGGLHTCWMLGDAEDADTRVACRSRRGHRPGACGVPKTWPPCLTAAFTQLGGSASEGLARDRWAAEACAGRT